jgi:hypothetical protein
LCPPPEADIATAFSDNGEIANIGDQQGCKNQPKLMIQSFKSRVLMGLELTILK